MKKSHIKDENYRGFVIRVMAEDHGFRAHWCESIEDKWTGGRWASSVDAAFDQAKRTIDVRCDRETEEVLRSV